MDNSFTHILCVKVWSPHIKMTTNYGNILSIIKNYIINANIHFISKLDGNNSISNWKMNQIDEPYNEMFSGDLVANISSDIDIKDLDIKIYDYTKEILQDIEHQMKAQNKLCDGEKIVFTIVRNIVSGL
jgi:hypothetical protein